MLSPEEIEDLKTRAKYAHANGFQIALAEQYAAELGYTGGEVPAGVLKFSPAHLLALIETGPIEKKFKQTKKVKAKADPEPVKADPEPVKAEAKPEPEPEPEPAPEPEPEPAPEPSES